MVMNLHPINRFLGTIISCLSLWGLSQTTSSADTNQVTQLKLEGIMFLSDQGQYWTIEELEKIARDHVWGNGKPLPASVLHVTACFKSVDSKTICVFKYSGKLGQPAWVVDVDSSGKVSNVTHVVPVDTVLKQPPTNQVVQPNK